MSKCGRREGEWRGGPGDESGHRRRRALVGVAQRGGRGCRRGRSQVVDGAVDGGVGLRHRRRRQLRPHRRRLRGGREGRDRLGRKTQVAEAAADRLDRPEALRLRVEGLGHLSVGRVLVLRVTLVAEQHLEARGR